MSEKLTTDWTNQTLSERLQYCKSMLYLHGMLTNRQNATIYARLMKRVEVLASNANTKKNKVRKESESCDS